MTETGNTDWQEIYRGLIEEAPYIPGDVCEKTDCSQIPWVNPNLIKRGQRFVEQNPVSINAVHCAGLFLGFSFKNLSTVLLRTAKFNGLENTKDRYIDTEDHIFNWYESDIIKTVGAGYNGLQAVRKMHSNALRNCLGGKDLSEDFNPIKINEISTSDLKRHEAKMKYIEALKSDLECVDTSKAPKEILTYNPKVLMSQFDFALTQYGFFAIIYLYPEKVGVYDTTDVEGFVHLWAVLGRLLGIQDRYNIALHANRELLMKIHDEIGLQSLKTMDLALVELQFDFVQAIGDMIYPKISPSAMLYHCFDLAKSVPEFKGDHLYSLMNWQDIFLLKIYHLLAFFMCHIWIFNKFVNSVFKIMASRNRKNILAQRKKRTRKKKNLAANI